MNSQQRRKEHRAKLRAPKEYWRVEGSAQKEENVLTFYIRLYADMCEVLQVNDSTGEITLASGEFTVSNDTYNATLVWDNGDRHMLFTFDKPNMKKSSEREFMTALGML